jgi:hypothetical protein
MRKILGEKNSTFNGDRFSRPTNVIRYVSYRRDHFLALYELLVLMFYSEIDTSRAINRHKHQLDFRIISDPKPLSVLPRVDQRPKSGEGHQVGNPA